ncbi:MAG: peptidylprolyl isomerase [Saprospiraceae bacterium]
MKNWILGLVLLATLVACTEPPMADKKLARVHNYVLYLSDLDGLFSENTSSSDSAAIIRVFRDRWIREALILHEAEQNKPDNLDIEGLVKNYRESLLKNSYEQVVVEQSLDSTIAAGELQGFYEKNKEQYELETPIVRCFFVKIPLPIDQVDSLRTWWNDPNPGHLQKMRSYCDQQGGTYILNDSLWTRLEEIAIELPKGSLTAGNVASKKDFQQRDDEFQYYLKVFEVKKRREIAPLSFIEEQARKVILHSRKIKLLQEKKESLYDVELRRKNIEIFEE